MAETRPRTRLDPEVRRRLILDAADSVFRDRHPDEVTFEEIAEAAGVSRALVYNYFGDRGGLLAEVYLRGFERLDEALDRDVPATAPLDERYVAVATAYLRFAIEHPAQWRLLEATSALSHPAVRSARARRFSLIAERLGDDGVVGRLVARALIAVLEAAAQQLLEEIEGGEAAIDDVEQLGEIVGTFAWQGVAGLSSVGIEPAAERIPLSRHYRSLVASGGGDT